MTEAPEAVDIVLINRPELPPAGAGESSIRPVAADDADEELAKPKANKTEVGEALKRALDTPGKWRTISSANGWAADGRAC